MNFCTFKKVSLVLLMAAALNLRCSEEVIILDHHHHDEQRKQTAKLYYALRAFGIEFVNGLVWNTIVPSSADANMGGGLSSIPLEGAHNFLSENGWRSAFRGGFIFSAAGYATGAFLGYAIKLRQ